MLSAPEMRAELEKLPSGAICQIVNALHELKDGIVGPAALDILWDRHATPGGSWPVVECGVGNPNDWGSGPRFDHKVVMYCEQGRVPHDVDHQVKRTLMYEELGGGRPRFECSCGRRTDRDLPSRLTVKRAQAEPTARVWPLVMRDGVPHYQVCQRARCADDPNHAPTEFGVRCLCGATIGELNGQTGDKFLPAY